MPHPNVPYFKSWIVFALSSTILGFLCGMASGALLGGILGASGVSIDTIKIVCGLAGFVFGLIISYVMFRWTIDRYIVPALTSNTRTEV